MPAPFKKIRAAMIGGGAFGECHLKTYHSMPHVEVAGLYTLKKDRGERLCQKYGGHLYRSLQDLANDTSIDVVSVATPENDHFNSFQLLAEQKKAIYVEKPLATAMDEARKMVEQSQSIIALLAALLLPALSRARESGRRAVCANNLRQFANTWLINGQAASNGPPYLARLTDASNQSGLPLISDSGGVVPPPTTVYSSIGVADVDHAFRNPGYTGLGGSGYLSPRHNFGANAVFADGHAKWYAVPVGNFSALDDANWVPTQ